MDEKNVSSGPRFLPVEDLPGILERGEVRISQPDYAGKATTNKEYIIESIFLPEAYIVPGDWKEPMQTYLHEIMIEQELADILAWLATLEEN